MGAWEEAAKRAKELTGNELKKNEKLEAEIQERIKKILEQYRDSHKVEVEIQEMLFDVAAEKQTLAQVFKGFQDLNEELAKNDHFLRQLNIATRKILDQGKMVQAAELLKRSESRATEILQQIKIAITKAKSLLGALVKLGEYTEKIRKINVTVGADRESMRVLIKRLQKFCDKRVIKHLKHEAKEIRNAFPAIRKAMPAKRKKS